MPWPSTVGISAVWVLLVAFAVICLASGEDDPQVPKVPDFLPSYMKPEINDLAPKGGSKVHYGKDGLCGWWNGKTYEKPLLNYTNPFAPPEEDGNGYYDEGMNRFCLYQFQRIAMQPVCGDPWYSRVKYCTMVQFYENKLPSVPANADKVLVMVDGCAICGTKTAQPDLKIALVNTWPAGSLFTKCKEEKHEAGKIEIKLKLSEYFESQVVKANGDMPKLKVPLSDKYLSTTFSFPAVLRQRKCKSVTSEDPPQKKYQGMMLEVTHKCTGDGNEETFNVPLDDITPSEFRNNMVELRGIMLFLKRGDNKWAQYRMEDYKYQNTKPIYDNMKDDDGDEKKKRKKKKK